VRAARRTLPDGREPQGAREQPGRGEKLAREGDEQNYEDRDRRAAAPKDRRIREGRSTCWREYMRPWTSAAFYPGGDRPTGAKSRVEVTTRPGGIERGAWGSGASQHRSLPPVVNRKPIHDDGPDPTTAAAPPDPDSGSPPLPGDHPASLVEQDDGQDERARPAAIEPRAEKGAASRRARNGKKPPTEARSGAETTSTECPRKRCRPRGYPGATNGSLPASERERGNQS
jgi:hypothetical protein